MEYTCIKTLNKIGKGFITTRAPKIIEKELIISFLGAPQGATAIFENSNGHLLYRLLADKSCVIPSDFLVGEITVTIVQLDGSSDAEKYHCEPIFADRKNNLILVYPNWLDIPMQIIDIYTELQGIKNDITGLLSKYDTLNDKVAKMLDGYDFD